MKYLSGFDEKSFYLYLQQAPKQLITDKQARRLILTDKRLTHCVTVILNSVAYQATLMPGALRYDFSGQSRGVVTEEEVYPPPSHGAVAK